MKQITYLQNLVELNTIALKNHDKRVGTKCSEILNLINEKEFLSNSLNKEKNEHKLTLLRLNQFYLITKIILVIIVFYFLSMIFDFNEFIDLYCPCNFIPNEFINELEYVDNNEKNITII